MTSSGSGGTPSASNSRPDPWPALTRAGRHVASALGAVLLAPLCLSCGAPLTSHPGSRVCAPCWDALELLPSTQCPGCGAPLPPGAPLRTALCGDCLGRRHVLARVHACGRYDGVLRALIHEVKYGGRTGLGHQLGRLARQHGAPVLEGADACVPVPLFVLKRLTRGFNQAALIAAELGLPVVRALRRRRWTPSQTALSAAGRHRNVAAAFAVRPGTVRGRVLVLVDDVRTTGATLDACADVLLAGGAAEVRALVLARADPPRPPGREPR